MRLHHRAAYLSALMGESHRIERNGAVVRLPGLTDWQPDDEMEQTIQTFITIARYMQRHTAPDLIDVLNIIQGQYDLAVRMLERDGSNQHTWGYHDACLSILNALNTTFGGPDDDDV